ncbi:ficolin-1-like [Drosophila willistoni]|uniref:ficolin-1-like n=1 Tax=Drosophila willistoni TaxID=7260 RepID=UPI001F079874|nr:ficolin-1-like [Drosophila willistoni]
MTALSYLTGLLCLLISSHGSHGGGLLKESREIGINATALAPGYTSCPPTIGANGIYQVEVPGVGDFSVYCEADIAGPGWIVIARRSNDKTNFFLKWDDYKKGFGDLSDDFFIGLDKLHAITATQNHELYIQLRDPEGKIRYARYEQFYIENENMQYQLVKANGFSGDAEDALNYQKGMQFSTYDKDHTNSCVTKKMGAWWYNDCAQSNLFGLYLDGAYNASELTGIYWRSYMNSKTVVMMVRPT